MPWNKCFCTFLLNYIFHLWSFFFSLCSMFYDSNYLGYCTVLLCFNIVFHRKLFYLRKYYFLCTIKTKIKKYEVYNYWRCCRGSYGGGTFKKSWWEIWYSFIWEREIHFVCILILLKISSCLSLLGFFFRSIFIKWKNAVIVCLQVFCVVVW